MVKIVPTPDWFIGKDVIIEFFSLVVLIIFAVLAYRYYNLNKNRNILYLGTGFGLIALAQLATILTKLVLYYDFGPTTQIGEAIITSNLVSSVDLFYYAGFFFSGFLTLLGLYIIYRLPRQRKSVGDYLIVLYFALISSLLSREIFYIYHLTALFILVLTVEKFSWIYKKNKFFNTKILMMAFGLLALSQLIFVLSTVDILFVLGNVVELISYTIFLALIIRIWKYGKEKKPYGNNIRYVGDSSGKRRQY
ncbi:MAG: hypothetical protein Q8P79_03630 [Nanoarchaeota archaeon]|nr:hypothetical protein [Nanoarchaeota archaeon]